MVSMFIVTQSHTERCPDCGGLGQIKVRRYPSQSTAKDDFMLEICPRCAGYGQVWVEDNKDLPKAVMSVASYGSAKADFVYMPDGRILPWRELSIVLEQK